MLVFFDPMGQALCKRTLNIVESLNETHGDRLRFYLSKADEAGGESDRQVWVAEKTKSKVFHLSHTINKLINICICIAHQTACVFATQRVMMQIVQELCKRPGLNKCGFDMPTIYIPNPNKVSALRPRSCISASFLIPIPQSQTCFFFPPATLPPPPQPSRCVNQIEEVCRTIEKTINQTVQNTLNSLEKDCELISEAITDTLLNDRCDTHTHTHTARFKSRFSMCPDWKLNVTPLPHIHACRMTSSSNRRARCKSCLLTLLGFSVPLALMALLVLGTLSKELLDLALGHEGTDTLSLYLVSLFFFFFQIARKCN